MTYSKLNLHTQTVGGNNEKRRHLHNLGCKVNAYETEAMQQLLEEAGYEIVPFDDRSGCVYYQYVFCDEYCGPQIQTDAP